MGAIDRLLLPPPPRAPMVVFPLVEFAKSLISPKIPVHAHMYVTIKQISKMYILCNNYNMPLKCSLSSMI